MNARTQPLKMKTKTYVYGVDILDGDDAWALFDASAIGDVETVLALLKKDRRLVNAQYCISFPSTVRLRQGTLTLLRFFSTMVPTQANRATPMTLGQTTINCSANRTH